MTRLTILFAAGLLSACSLTPQDQSALTTVGTTLASVAAEHNQTAANLLSQGALICGKASTVEGQLLAGTAVALANAAGVPVSVTDQAQADVAAACSAIGLVAGPAPDDQASIPVASSTTTLPPVPVP